jgi:hypothetical protein
MTSEAAFQSLVPVPLWEKAIDGACHWSSFSSPPAPRVWPSVPIIGRSESEMEPES